MNMFTGNYTNTNNKRLWMPSTLLHAVILFYFIYLSPPPPLPSPPWLWICKYAAQCTINSPMLMYVNKRLRGSVRGAPGAKMTVAELTRPLGPVCRWQRERGPVKRCPRWCHMFNFLFARDNPRLMAFSCFHGRYSFIHSFIHSSLPSPPPIGPEDVDVDVDVAYRRSALSLKQTFASS